jgi:hypothetical protein
VHLKHEEDDRTSAHSGGADPGGLARLRRSDAPRQGVKGAAPYVPWILLDGMPPIKQQTFLAALPAPVRVINRLVWQSRYRQRNLWNANR